MRPAGQQISGRLNMYFVVEFPEENNFTAVVPQTWCTGKTCYWPPYPNTDRIRKASINQETPDLCTWTNHPIIIKKRKDNYTKAHAFYIRAKKGESLDTEPEDGDKKRQRKKNLKYHLDCDDEEEEVGRFPCAPKPPRFDGPPKKKSKQLPSAQPLGLNFKKATDQSEDSVQFHAPPTPMTTSGHQSGGGYRFSTDPTSQGKYSANSSQNGNGFLLQHIVNPFSFIKTDSVQFHAPPTPMTTSGHHSGGGYRFSTDPTSQAKYSANSSQNGNGFLLQHIVNPFSFIETDSVQFHAPPTPMTTSGHQSGGYGCSSLGPAFQHPENFYRLILQHLRELAEELRDVKQQVSLNTAILQSLTAGTNVDMSIPPDVILPLEDRSMLEDIERELGQNLELTEKLVAYLASRGGRNLKDSVKRIFQSLFTNNLAMGMNWTGSGQKVSFNSLHLKRVIHRAVRKNPATGETTEEALQKEVSRFLKGASDREGGRRQRQRQGEPRAEN
ncbi:uncharacterized protein LOC114839945 isoform X2 [Esox lucius]|uniref:uncharacterized protein LOC114839945 isoform X2 n=1 Tax=Esox lucius TaxID=8010 RepID=UPI001476DCD3|nr:uncharacterized protein LOC114839945 isoform X2 [Esox lucius]